MMKMRSVIAASAAVLTICAANAVSFAESADTNLVSAKDNPGEENNTTADNTSADDADAAEPSDKDNADTGVESVAAVVGAIALAGAAVVISRKRA